MKIPVMRAVLCSVVLVGGLCLNTLAADGVVSLPYTNTFEMSDGGTTNFVGYPIVSNVGWGVAYETTNAAVVTNWTEYGPPYAPPSPYLPSVMHSNVLEVAGTVSNVFDANAYDYVYIDVCVRPQLRDTPPNDQVTPLPQAAAYINSQSNLVFYHRWYNGDYTTPKWTTNDQVVISSNDWVRLSFELAYQNYGPPDYFYNDAFFRIRINGSTDYFTNDLAYSLENTAGEPLPIDYETMLPIPLVFPRNWFMCANTGYRESPDSLHSFTVSGSAQIDDYVVAGQSSISMSDTNVLEGALSTTTDMVFTVSLGAPEAADVPIQFSTADGTAIADSDYVATNGTVLIPAGQLSVSIVVIVNGDNTANGDRNFTVSITRPSSPNVLATVTGTITDDDTTTPGYTVHGTPHLWLEYYSLTNGGYEVADTNDFDGDGTTEWQEYWAGTDPTNNASVFKIVSVTTNFTITWIGGTNEITPPAPPWIIYRATNLVGDPNTIWTNLPSTNLDRDAYLLSSTNSRWTDPQGGMYAPRVFYRITTTTNAH